MITSDVPFWFPLTDRNPQHFLIISDAKAADFKKAVQRVFAVVPTAPTLWLLC